MMRLLQSCLVFSLILCCWFTSIEPAIAASSAAIRAYDDVSAETKDYSGQDLIGAEFGDSKLRNANFKGANLRGAVFNGAVLSQANWHGVDFSDGIAYLSNFAGADLSDAIFTDAMLLKSSFRDTDITGADFSDAMLDREQILQLCRSASGTNSVTGIETRESLGCR